jgi:hypothetical protein
MATMKTAAKRRFKRRGMASMEVVMTAAISLPPAVAIAWLGIKVSKFLFQVNAPLVGWPFL